MMRVLLFLLVGLAMVREPIVYLNGEYRPESEARISVFDRGLVLGDGVFDVVSAWRGSIFKLDRHIERFFQSLRAARLDTAMTRDDWRQAIIETTRRNGLADASIRFLVTRGVPESVVGDPRRYEPTRIVWAAPYVFLADEATRQRGIRLHISQVRGFSPETLDPRYKCLNRLHFQLARIEALEAGYDEVTLLTPGGYLGESSSSNVFFVKNGTLCTPEDDVLQGITRETVFEIAREAGIPVRTGRFTPFDLFTADEVFTTSTAGGPLAVREVSGRTLPASPGLMTAAITSAYWKMREEGRHCTPIGSNQTH